MFLKYSKIQSLINNLTLQIPDMETRRKCDFPSWTETDVDTTLRNTGRTYLYPKNGKKFNYVDWAKMKTEQAEVWFTL